MRPNFWSFFSWYNYSSQTSGYHCSLKWSRSVRVGIKASLSLALTHYRFLISAVTLTLGSSYNLLEGGASQEEINHTRNRHPENVNSIKHRQEINHCQPQVTSAMLCSQLWSLVRVSNSGRGSPSSSWILLYFRFWFPVRNKPSFVMTFCASAIITHHLWIYAKANTRWWWRRKLSGVLTFKLKGVCLGKEAGLWKNQASNKTGCQQPVQCDIQGSWGAGGIWAGVRF